MKRTTLKVALLMLLAVVALSMPLKSFAGPIIELTLQSGASTVVITDGGAGDSCGVTGCITFIGAVGAWSLNITTGQGTGVLAFPGLLDITSASTTGAASTLTISLTEYNLTTPTGLLTPITTLGGTQHTGSTTFQSYYDPSNTKYGMATLLGKVGPLSGLSFSGTALGPATTFGGTYSLTDVATLIATGADSKSFDGELLIPEPAELSLLGFGLFSLGTALRRKFLAC